MATFGKWVAKLGRWVTKLLRWVAKLKGDGWQVGSAPGSLGLNSDISQKYKMGDISKRSPQQKNFLK
jgi:hypothetical protein